EVPENSVVLLTRNDHHVLGSGPGLRPITPEEHLEVDADSGIMRICYGGGGERTRIVCGFVGTEVQRHPLVDALPPVLVLPMRDEPSCHWIATSFRYAAESIGHAPGRGHRARPPVRADVHRSGAQLCRRLARGRARLARRAARSRRG